MRDMIHYRSYPQVINHYANASDHGGITDAEVAYARTIAVFFEQTQRLIDPIPLDRIGWGEQAEAQQAAGEAAAAAQAQAERKAAADAEAAANQARLRKLSASWWGPPPAQWVQTRVRDIERRHNVRLLRYVESVR